MQSKLSAISANLASVIKGKNERIDLLLAAILARGHVLIEDMPGLGKTTLAKGLARSLEMQFRRIQFTPDLLPSDVLGGSIYNPREGTFHFHEGPIFTNILLADEINRASPRTQSALLEAMAERQATIEGVRHDLPNVFLVMATQNPIEFYGTYPLPEAQLDRFLIQMTMGYADFDTEVQLLYDQQQVHPLERLAAVATAEDMESAQDAVRNVHVAPEIGRYIVELVRATRNVEQVQVGVSPRGALGLFRLAQAIAYMDGRDHVIPDDVQQSAVPVLAHRLILETRSRYDGTSKLEIIEQVKDQVAVPT